MKKVSNTETELKKIVTFEKACSSLLEEMARSHIYVFLWRDVLLQLLQLCPKRSARS